MLNSSDTVSGIVGSQTELKKKEGKADEHRHSLVCFLILREEFKELPHIVITPKPSPHDGLCLLKLGAEIDLSFHKFLCIPLVTAMRKVTAMVDVYVI